MDALPAAQRQSLNIILDNCKQQCGRIKLLSYEGEKVRIEIVDAEGFIAKGVILPDGKVIGHYNTRPQWPKKTGESS